MTAICLFGAEGRMGEAIRALTAVTDAGPQLEHLAAGSVLIDFSSPEGAVLAAKACAEHGVPLVTGTTGLSDREQKTIAEAAERIPVVQSGNMSLGITLLRRLVAEAAEVLEGFDIEILETHHRHKKDSPSGTALLLGEAAARARGSALSEAARFTRHGRDAERRSGEIGFAVRRGGGVFGEHEVAFMSEGETVTLGHQALGRESFARGALAAAHWVEGRRPGLYGMDHVLGFVPA
ncbi:MAG: 4-hydroxy-tetrahydrodipicolinate reductase [Parvularcula sp.]|jgi:4-hydroxy-tetrahydrodipicolinate reductase|nr:4-hydroxy-tetrahydrodipicolinate reductase [Parvularcula sp.]